MFTVLVSLTVLAGTALAGDGPQQRKDYEKMLRERQKPSVLDRLRDTTHRPVNPKAVAAFERLQKASDQSKKWLVSWDSTTGCAAGLWGGRFWVRGAARKDQATNLLNDYFELFWQPDPRVKPPKPEFRVGLEPAGSVDLDMYSQGLKVYRAGFRVGFERDGSISTISANMPILQEIEISPHLTPRQATDAVRRSWKTGKALQESRLPDSPGLVIYPSRPPRLMYSIYVADGPHLLVDANTGEVFPGLWAGSLFYRGVTDPAVRTELAKRPESSIRPVQPRSACVCPWL